MLNKTNLILSSACSLNVYTKNSIFLQKWAIPVLFLLISSLFKQILQFLQQIYVLGFELTTYRM